MVGLGHKRSHRGSVPISRRRLLLVGIDNLGLSLLCFQRLHLGNIRREVQDQLDRCIRVPVLVIAVHVSLQLPAVSYDLLSPLLECDTHVVRVSTPYIVPKVA